MMLMIVSLVLLLCGVTIPGEPLRPSTPQLSGGTVLAEDVQLHRELPHPSTPQLSGSTVLAEDVQLHREPPHPSTPPNTGGTVLAGTMRTSSTPPHTDTLQLSEGTVLADNLQQPREVRLSTLGTLFVAEAGRHRLLILDPHGQRLDSLGRLGSGHYQFDTPVGVEPTNELRIYVADRGNRRIQIFDRRMQYLSTVHIPTRTGSTQPYEPALMSVDPAGRLYFYDSLQQRVHRLNARGQHELNFELIDLDERIIPAAMQMAGDQLWVATYTSGVLHRFSSSGGWMGFVPVNEAVIALRKRHGNLWVLGTHHIIEFDVRGNELRRIALPHGDMRGDQPGTAAPERVQPRRLFGIFRRSEPGRHDGSTIRWRSFDIGESHVYLMDADQIMRWPLPVSDNAR